MFSRLSEEDFAAPIVTATSQHKGRPRSSAMPSIIGIDIVIDGMITTTGDIQLDGRLDGNICGAGVAIGSSGQIYGDIVADDVIVRGHIKGSIRAHRVLLCSTCHVEGDILHEALKIEAGAFFEGTCFHRSNLLIDDQNYAEKIKPATVRATPRPRARIPTQDIEKALRPLYLAFLAAREAYSPVRLRTFSKCLILLLLSAGLVFAIPDDRLAGSAWEKTAEALQNQIISGHAFLSAASSNFEKKVQSNFWQLIGRGDSIMRATSRLFEVTANWIDAMTPRSGVGPKLLVKSQPIMPKTRAIRMTQLAPTSQEKMPEPHGPSVDPYNPHYNVSEGTAYLRTQYQKYASAPIINTYNSVSSGNLDDHIQNSLPANTRANMNDTASVPSAGTQRSTRSSTRLVDLTRPDGSPVWIDVTTVKSVRETFPGEYASGVQSVVSWGNSNQGVRESVAAAAALIKGHGGKL